MRAVITIRRYRRRRFSYEQRAGRTKKTENAPLIGIQI